MYAEIRDVKPLTKYDLIQSGRADFRPGDDARFFRNTVLVHAAHRSYRQKDLVTAQALQNAILPVLEKFIPKEADRPVLEVGCGDGFFREAVAPDWLRERLVSFDIHSPSLMIARQRSGKTARLFQGNVYELPAKRDAIDAVIGFSSFDSFGLLRQSLQQVGACLREGGHLVLFQDMLADLHAPVGLIQDLESIHTYHRNLIEVVDGIGCLEVVEGRDVQLEATTTERVGVAIGRAFGALQPITPKPLLVTSSLGKFEAFFRSDVPFIGTTLDKVGTLRRADRKLDPKMSFLKVKYREDELIEWVRLRYLVARKK